jgi:hypothetical protein
MKRPAPGITSSRPPHVLTILGKRQGSLHPARSTPALIWSNVNPGHLLDLRINEPRGRNVAPYFDPSKHKMIWQTLSLLVGLMSVRGEVGHNETDDSESL